MSGKYVIPTTATISNVLQMHFVMKYQGHVPVRITIITPMESVQQVSVIWCQICVLKHKCKITKGKPISFYLTSLYSLLSQGLLRTGLPGECSVARLPWFLHDHPGHETMMMKSFYNDWICYALSTGQVPIQHEIWCQAAICQWCIFSEKVILLTWQPHLCKKLAGTVTPSILIDNKKVFLD